MDVKDSNGTLLAEGDSVTLIKHLKVKGSSLTLKRGTVVKNIRLTNAEIEGRASNGAQNRVLEEGVNLNSNSRLMGSKILSQLLRVLGTILLLVPILLVGWFLPDLPGLFSDSNERRKPMSAEAKFFLLVFVLLLIIGFISWWIWHRIGTH